MIQIVADSSTLILLAKCDLAEAVCDMFEVIVPESVIAEVASEDLTRNYPDAAAIAEFFSKGAIEVQSPLRSNLLLPITLHKGEKDALELAYERKGALFATDDGKAIKAARFLKVPYIITPKIVVELFGLRKISLKKARDSLEKLAVLGRYSPEIIADALVKLMEESHDQTHDNKNT
ncbi:MAG: hypothetical protein JRJ03_13780 [Deltaproteobacteria bacterium]|nr:hypothetical protein [Deltaproteobacteria bacterium]